MISDSQHFYQMTWKRFYKHRLGCWALYLVVLFCLVGIYAPFLASSKPFVVIYKDQLFFPLFRYLFYSGFYSKRLDLFFNWMIFTAPLFFLASFFLKKQWRMRVIMLIGVLQIGGFLYCVLFPLKDPAVDLQLSQARVLALQAEKVSGKPIYPNWQFDLQYMNAYAQLNLLLRYQQQKRQQQHLSAYQAAYVDLTGQTALPTLWGVAEGHEKQEIARQQTILQLTKPGSQEYQQAQATLDYLKDKRQWLESQSSLLYGEVMPLLSHFHWEEDAGGQLALNQVVPWWDLTRINRKDLLAALIFGIRISLVVGIISVSISLLIGIPIGALAGFYAGRTDIFICRLLEVWEAMPAFFMLLMITAILQSKSIFLVIAVIGLFGWTQFSRYIRGEFFKQRNLAYIEACYSLGFRNRYIMFKHMLPNAIPPVLTLLPFAMMGAITSEAALSFLGLGEEGSCSWGVLMDEGRTAFPQESYLLWPPAILLTLLLISIAVVGDHLRDALDPKMR